MALSPAERKALVLSTFTASCIAFAPAEIVSAIALLIAFGLLYRWDLRRSAEEAEEAARDEAVVGEGAAEGRAAGG